MTINEKCNKISEFLKVNNLKNDEDLFKALYSFKYNEYLSTKQYNNYENRLEAPLLVEIARKTYDSSFNRLSFIRRYNFEQLINESKILRVEKSNKFTYVVFTTVDERYIYEASCIEEATMKHHIFYNQCKEFLEGLNTRYSIRINRINSLNRYDFEIINETNGLTLLRDSNDEFETCKYYLLSIDNQARKPVQKIQDGGLWTQIIRGGEKQEVSSIESASFFADMLEKYQFPETSNIINKEAFDNEVYEIIPEDYTAKMDLSF